MINEAIIKLINKEKCVIVSTINSITKKIPNKKDLEKLYINLKVKIVIVAFFTIGMTIRIYFCNAVAPSISAASNNESGR